jgi:hypothetical protein
VVSAANRIPNLAVMRFGRERPHHILRRHSGRIETLMAGHRANDARANSAPLSAHPAGR